VPDSGLEVLLLQLIELFLQQWSYKNV